MVGNNTTREDYKEAEFFVSKDVPVTHLDLERWQIYGDDKDALDKYRNNTPSLCLTEEGMISKGAQRMKDKHKASVESGNKRQLTSSQPAIKENKLLHNHVMRSLRQIQDDDCLNKSDMDTLKHGWDGFLDRLYKKSRKSTRTHQQDGKKGALLFVDDYSTSKRQPKYHKRAT